MKNEKDQTAVTIRLQRVGNLDPSGQRLLSLLSGLDDWRVVSYEYSQDGAFCEEPTFEPPKQMARLVSSDEEDVEDEKLPSGVTQLYE